jgi:hypothetical protein
LNSADLGSILQGVDGRLRERVVRARENERGFGLVGRATEAKSWTWYYLFVVFPGVLSIRYTLPRDIG